MNGCAALRPAIGEDELRAFLSTLDKRRLHSSLNEPTSGHRLNKQFGQQSRTGKTHCFVASLFFLPFSCFCCVSFALPFPKFLPFSSISVCFDKICVNVFSLILFLNVFREFVVVCLIFVVFRFPLPLPLSLGLMSSYGIMCPTCSCYNCRPVFLFGVMSNC